MTDPKSTYATFAEAFADEDRGGRFAAVNKTTVVGTDAMPKYPEGPAWCAGDQGVEPPLGVDINEMPPTGEVFEVERSIQQLGGADEAPASASLPLRDAVETTAPPTSDDDEAA